MAFKKESVMFLGHSDAEYRVEITAGDGTIIKRTVSEEELDDFCKQHGFSHAQINEELAALKT